MALIPSVQEPSNEVVLRHAQTSIRSATALRRRVHQVERPQPLHSGRPQSYGSFR